MVNPYDGRTEQLLDLYNDLQRQRSELAEKALGIRAELDERSNLQGKLENAVIAGDAEVLRSVGVPSDVIDEAVRRVTERKLAKIAAREAAAAADGGAS